MEFFYWRKCYYGLETRILDKKCCVDYCDVFIRLSFWRHPFTAKHPLLRHWCNATFLQIWWRNKLEDVSIFSKLSFLGELILYLYASPITIYMQIGLRKTANYNSVCKYYTKSNCGFNFKCWTFWVNKRFSSLGNQNDWWANCQFNFRRLILVLIVWALEQP